MRRTERWPRAAQGAQEQALLAAILRATQPAREGPGYDPIALDLPHWREGGGRGLKTETGCRGEEP